MDTTILDCGHPPSRHTIIGTGYGTDADGKRHCYACCAARDLAAMAKDGRATMYLIPAEKLPRIPIHSEGYSRVTNWPGSLEFRTGEIRKGRHNIARVRYDTWFTGPALDGTISTTWHAVQYGDNTQTAHCRRVKG